VSARILLAAVLVLACGALATHAAAPRPVPLRAPLTGVPWEVGEWRGSPIDLGEEVLGLLGTTDHLSRLYEHGTDGVDVYVGYYASQGAGHQIHAPRHCLPGSGWVQVADRREVLDLPGAGRVDLVEALYRKGGTTRILAYWYRMRGGTVTGEYALKLRMVLNALRYGSNEAAFLRFSTPVSGGEAAARRLLHEFMRDFVPLLEERLPPRGGVDAHAIPGGAPPVGTAGSRGA